MKTQGTRHITALLALTAALLGVGGCADANGDAGPGEDAATTPTPTASAEASPAEEEADPAPWLSLIAVETARLEDATASWDEAICSSSVVADGAPDCGAMMTTLSLVADTSAITLRGAVDEASPSYLGDVPAELADVWAGTLDAAEAASAAGAAATSACPGDGCLSAAFVFEMALGDLDESFTAWAPYL